MSTYFEELESWAASTEVMPAELGEPDPDNVLRYQELFSCTYQEAILKIQRHRSDLLGQIHDAGQDGSPPLVRRSGSARNVAYLVKVEGILSDPEIFMAASRLSKTPEVVSGSSETGDSADFYRIDGPAKAAILSFLAQERSVFRPTFLQITKADKSLCPWSGAPTLNVDTTLPQHRATSQTAEFLPSQHQYPVWYFFYGMLADSNELSFILKLRDRPSYRSAVVHGGAMLAERQLVDAESRAQGTTAVPGSAYLVENVDDEDSLRFSVTEQYEVVRCSIEFLDTGEIMPGLTFRFILG